MLDKDFSKTLPHLIAGADPCDNVDFEDRWIVFNAIKVEQAKHSAYDFMKATGITNMEYQRIVDNSLQNLSTDFLIRCLRKLGRKVTIKVE